MFLNRKTLLGVFTLLAITGCVNTVNLEQQQQITNLQSSLSRSQILVTEVQTELSNNAATIKENEEKITALTDALAKSQKSVQLAKTIKPTVVAPTLAPIQVSHIDDKTILGQAEWVYVSTVKDNFRGRIDTGATTSSINAVHIERFERDGEKWVRFNLTHAEGENAEIIEAKVVRVAKIIQSSNPDANTERLVVKLHVRIGDVSQLTEFTLTNRTHMAYPVLIGRTFMRDVILVDVSKEYIFPKYQAPTEE